MQAKDYAARRRNARAPERLIGLAMQLAQARDLRAAVQTSQLAERLMRLEKAARVRRAEMDYLAALAAERAASKKP